MDYIRADGNLAELYRATDHVAPLVSNQKLPFSIRCIYLYLETMVKYPESKSTVNPTN